LIARDLDGGAESVLLQTDSIIGWTRVGRPGLDWRANGRIFVAGYDVSYLVEVAPSEPAPSN
jgi:hypothetical protein